MTGSAGSTEYIRAQNGEMVFAGGRRIMVFDKFTGNLLRQRAIPDRSLVPAVLDDQCFYTLSSDPPHASAEIRSAQPVRQPLPHPRATSGNPRDRTVDGHTGPSDFVRL